MKGLFIQSYGCQMNSSDSERMRALLSPLGFETVNSPEGADLVLINTCSIRDKAENKMTSFAHDLKFLKKDHPQMQIGITGCVAQQEKNAILENLPFVDFVMGPDNIDELPWILEETQKSGTSVLRTEFDTSSSRVWKTKTLIKNPGPTAFVSVMKGCDHFCSYCIVPFTRGREKSRPIQDIYEDVRDLCSQGVREITFLGQNINTFGKRAGESLAELFKKVHDIKDLFRIRFTTSHPGDLEDSLIECFTTLPKLCSSFHLPVQSGSNSILKNMRRFYTREEYLEKVQKLRNVRPDIALSTDIIVGFPGETDEDFEQTLSLAAQVKFDNAYSFVYSARPGTTAEQRYTCNLSEKKKLERLTALQNLLRKDSRELHEQDVGSLKEILLEGKSKKDSAKVTGRTSQNVPVHLDLAETLKLGYGTGDLVSVRILSATLTHLKGEPVRLKSTEHRPKQQAQGLPNKFQEGLPH